MRYKPFRLLQLALLMLLAACASEPDDDSPFLELYQAEKGGEYTYNLDIPHNILKLAVSDQSAEVKTFMDAIRDLRVIGIAAQDNPLETFERRVALKQAFDEMVAADENPYEVLENFAGSEFDIQLVAERQDTLLAELLLSVSREDQLQLVRLKGDFTEAIIRDFVQNADLGALESLLKQESN